ncbi:bifunctional hydroxymethylpyrimidine kinase/phosphomethylpyrimidine kinase [Maribacter antarcticus]|uniref:bifunctional hydroxymethylpyrimidine kinase/phosphomethylpyrimidine kinase n=1 Tax=Maribacter antarcticus TaxID=505250 RepID=UPI00047B9278|nr:bifunctional hydroxymethylpyrimidine kinase/phosphomethylpyrimidine kinase [Maribacter antarcticus]
MENLKTRYCAVLTIAGSDSGGCAGIQADIKSISACGVFAASVITATTAQNTQGIFDIHPIPIVHLEKQLDAVLSDIAFGAIKIGMLHSSEVIETVANKLAQYSINNIVLDPVMVATSGDNLIVSDAISSLKDFLPKARLITPNIPEAELLIGHPIELKNLKNSASEIGRLYHTSVLLKGGHIGSHENQITDTLYVYENDEIITIKNPWVNTKNTHGTGCSLSSSIAAFLSLGYNLEDAVKKGCHYINRAITQGEMKILGKGNGPINHFGLK